MGRVRFKVTAHGLPLRPVYLFEVVLDTLEMVEKETTRLPKGNL